MSKITVVIADKDELYLERLASYFMEHNAQFDISTFSSDSSFRKFLLNQGKIDLVIIDPSMHCDQIYSAHISAKILLVSGTEKLEGYESVKKFQKAGNILQEVLLKYAEATGNIDSIKGKQRTKTVAFYSPIGGSGKTTLALVTAVACAAAGLRTFYLNLEKIDSTKFIFEKSPETMSKVFLELQLNGVDVGVKILSCKGEDALTGIHYISAPNSIAEYAEVTDEGLDTIVKSLIHMSEYDVLILDFSSEFYSGKAMLLENSDLIFMPVIADLFSVSRIQTFFHESELHQEYDSILKRVKLVVNKADTAGVSPILQESGIFNQYPMAAVINMSPIFANQQNLLRSAEILRSTVSPLVSYIMEGKEID